MNAASPGSQREFLLKQIENEIDAGFTLVAAARRAYASRQPGEGDDAASERPRCSSRGAEAYVGLGVRPNASYRSPSLRNCAGPLIG